MNNYEILGRIVVTGFGTVAFLFIWFSMMGDVWKWGPLK